MTSLSRKDFFKTSTLGLIGLSTAPKTLFNQHHSNDMKQESYNLPTAKYSIKNVRLETGFEYEKKEIVSTKTELFTIEISNGKIKSISNNQPNLDAIDAKGLLMLPSFKDMHIHLDKTLYTEKWRSVRPSG